MFNHYTNEEKNNNSFQLSGLLGSWPLIESEQPAFLPSASLSEITFTERLALLGQNQVTPVSRVLTWLPHTWQVGNRISLLHLTLFWMHFGLLADTHGEVWSRNMKAFEHEMAQSTVFPTLRGKITL